MGTKAKFTPMITAEVAYMLGVSVQKVAMFAKETVDPLPSLGRDPNRRGTPMTFDPAMVMEWNIRRNRKNMLGGQSHLDAAEAAGEDTDNVISFHIEKARLTKAQADEKELLLAEKRGELLPLDVIDEVIGPVIDEFRSTVDAIPAELGRSCPELSASAIDVVKRVLARFSNSLADREFAQEDLG